MVGGECGVEEHWCDEHRGEKKAAGTRLSKEMERDAEEEQSKEAGEEWRFKSWGYKDIILERI